MAKVGEPCNVAAHAKIPAVLPDLTLNLNNYSYTELDAALSQLDKTRARPNHLKPILPDTDFN